MDLFLHCLFFLSAADVINAPAKRACHGIGASDSNSTYGAACKCLDICHLTLNDAWHIDWKVPCTTWNTRTFWTRHV